MGGLSSSGGACVGGGEFVQGCDPVENSFKPGRIPQHRYGALSKRPYTLKWKRRGVQCEGQR